MPIANMNYKLTQRIGELGAPAVPLLALQAFGVPSQADQNALVGLCRAGVAAQALVPQFADLLDKERIGTANHRIAFIALMRMGKPERALAALRGMVDDNAGRNIFTRQRTEDYEWWAANVHPASAAEVCDERRVPRAMAGG